MAKLTTHARCPACDARMAPRVLECPACELRIESHFKENEFAGLDDEWLHFLRIFIHCEGRITDIESALGISYPTVKSRIAELKRQLALEHKPQVMSSDTVSDVLTELEAGEIGYDEAMQRLES